MSDLFPDLVGFTGNRNYQSVPAASCTINNIVSRIVSTAVSVGWTILSGPTPVTAGDEYELYSAQAPWHDPLNTPAWYLGGRVYLKITYVGTTVISFRVGEYYNGTIVDPISTTTFSITPNSYLNNGFDFRLLCNPYEIWIWSSETTRSLTGGTLLRSAYMGTLNVPKPVQESLGVISSILADKFAGQQLLQGSATQYHLWRTNGNSPISFYGDLGGVGNRNRSQFISMISGATNNSYDAGKRIWNPTIDSLMENNEAWWPFFNTSQVAYQLGGSASNATWQGFLWDSFTINASFSRNAVIRMINKDFICYAGTETELATPATLWLNIGPSGTIL